MKIDYARKKAKKTNYAKRLKMLLSNEPRVVIRKSNKHMRVQIVKYDLKGDKTVAQAHSKELKKYGWGHGTSNLPAAYLVGLIAGKKAKQKKIEKVIMDAGLASITKGAKIFAALKGVADASVMVPFDKKILPSEERIRGEHIQKKDVSKSFEETHDRILYHYATKQNPHQAKLGGAQKRSSPRFVSTTKKIIGEKK